MDITITQHDAGFVINATLKRGATPIDVSGADEVVFLARSYPGNYLKINGVCTLVTDGTDGKVRYTTTAADVNTAGIYRAKFRIRTGLVKVSVPNDRDLALEILRDLA